MPAISRLQRLVAARTDDRRRAAEALALQILNRMRAAGHDAVVVGSLATGRFRLHSDIDFWVRDAVDPPARAGIERIVATAMRGTGVSYDLIFACDLTGSQREAFEHDLIVASRLRQARTEARAGEP